MRVTGRCRAACGNLWPKIGKGLEIAVSKPLIVGHAGYEPPQ